MFSAIKNKFSWVLFIVLLGQVSPVLACAANDHGENESVEQNEKKWQDFKAKRAQKKQLQNSNDMQLVPVQGTSSSSVFTEQDKQDAGYEFEFNDQNAWSNRSRSFLNNLGVFEDAML